MRDRVNRDRRDQAFERAVEQLKQRRTMTDTVIFELKIGDYVCDMHYGMRQLTDNFTVVSHVHWDEPHKHKGTLSESGYVDHPFSSYIQEFVAPRAYCNKHLHVIGFDDRSTLSTPILICAYCRDGRTSGIILISPKTDGEKETSQTHTSVI